MRLDCSRRVLLKIWAHSLQKSGLWALDSSWVKKDRWFAEVGAVSRVSVLVMVADWGWGRRTWKQTGKPNEASEVALH